MRVTRWLVRTVLALLVTVVVVTAVALVVVQTDWFKDRIRQFAVTRVATVLNGRLSIGRLSGSLFRGVVLDNVVLAQAEGPVFRARQIVVRYDPMVLIQRGIILDDVTIRHADIRLTQNAAGWNVATLLKPRTGTGKGPPAFTIDRLTLTDGDVTIAPANAGTRRVRDVATDVRLVQDRHGLATTIARLTALDERSGTLIEQVTGAFDSSLTHVDATFVAVSNQARMSGSVQGRRAGDGGRELTMNIDLTRFDASRLLENAAWVTDITGQTTTRVTMPPSGSPTITFAFAGPYASAFGYQGRDLDVTGVFTDGRLAFTGNGVGYGAALTIDAGWQLAPRPHVPAGFAGTGTFRHADLTRLPLALKMPPFESDLAGSFHLAYNAGHWEADTTLATSRLEDATIAAGTTGHLEVRRDVVSYRAEGRVENMNLRRLAGPLEIETLAQARFESRITGPFRAEGRGTNAKTRHLAAAATLEHSSVSTATFDAARVGLALDGQRLEVSADGDFAGVTASLAGLPPSTSFDLTGCTNIRVVFHDLSGPFTLETVDASGRIDLASSDVQGIKLTRATADGEMSGGVASLREFTAELPGAKATAIGTVALGSTAESSLKVDVSAEDLRGIGAALKQPLAGGADLRMEVTGPADHTRATGTLNGHALAYGDDLRALTLETTFTVDVPDADFSRLTLDGQLDGTFLEIASVELVRAHSTARYENREVMLDTRLEQAERSLDMAGVVSVAPDGRTVALRRLRVQASDATWALPNGREARVRMEPNRVRIDGLELRHGDGRVSAEGTFALAPEAAPASVLNVTAEHVQMADINQLLLGTRDLAGVVDGDVAVSGTIKAPSVKARFAIVNGAVEGVHYDAVEVTVDLVDGRATIDARLDQTPTNHLTVTGTVPVPVGSTSASTGAGMDLQVKSAPIDLALAQAFTSELRDIAGTGTFNMHITGTTGAPILNGSAGIANAAFLVESTGVRYQDIAARLEFVHNHLQIGDFLLRDDDGHELKAVGGLDVFGGEARALDLKVTAENLHVLENRLGLVQVDADVTVSGSVGAPRVAGTLRVDQGRIEVDEVLEATTKRVYSTRPQALEDEAAIGAADRDALPAAEVTGELAPLPRPVSAAPKPSLFDRVDLSLEVELPDNVVLRGRDLRASGASMGLGDMNIIAGGTLDLRKAPGGKAVVVGEMGIVRGYYSFQGRRFSVQRDSTVRFRGLSPIDPIIDVTADREISGVAASVHVGGTLSGSKIDLSSQPPLDDADVLSLIVFGQPVNDLGLSQRSSLTERAASMAASAIATPIADSVARVLGLDLFEIQAPTEDERSPTVSLGGQIGARLYVGLKQEIGRGDASAVSLEYRVADFLRLVMSAAQGAVQRHATSRDETGGIDLIFVFRY